MNATMKFKILTVHIKRNDHSRTLGVFITTNKKLSCELAYKALEAASVKPSLSKIEIKYNDWTAIFDDSPGQEYWVVFSDTELVNVTDTYKY